MLERQTNIFSTDKIWYFFLMLANLNVQFEAASSMDFIIHDTFTEVRFTYHTIHPCQLTI